MVLNNGRDTFCMSKRESKVYSISANKKCIRPFECVDSNEVRKSNIIAVNPPLEMPLKEQLVDRYFAYITVNAEAPPPDMRLEGIILNFISYYMLILVIKV